MRTAEINTTGSAAKPTVSDLISERSLKRYAIVALLMLAAYLVGFVPNWMSSKALEEDAAGLKNTNQLLALKTDLAAAAMHAEQGRFDEAITAAGSFFGRLDKGIGAADGTLNNEPAREAAVNMLARRDEVIAMLARGDRTAADVLAGWFFEFEKTTNVGK